MPISSHVLILFSREIKSEFSPTCADSLIVRYSSIRLILIQIRYEMAEVTPLSQHASSKSPVSMLSTKKRDSDVTCCFTHASSSRRAVASRESVSPSGSPPNKSGSLPRNGEAGSNAIDVREPQSEKQRRPMTVTEAGR
jgi:hypothetical protein